MVINIENEMLATYVDFTRFRQIRRIDSAAGAEKEFELQDIKRLYGPFARIGDAPWQEWFLHFIFCQFIETQKEKGWCTMIQDPSSHGGWKQGAGLRRMRDISDESEFR